jgi:CRISPR-associated protein Csd1
MIRELSELGKTLRAGKADGEWVHDALKEETITMVLTMRADGSFVSLQRIENKKTMAEAVQRTSGKGARLLIDNCGYVLGTYDPDGSSFKKKAKEKGEEKAHEIFTKDVTDKLALFVDRIDELNNLEELKPLLRFYQSNKANGIKILTQEAFLNTIFKKDRGGNIAILISGNNKYVHEYDTVYAAIVDKYEKKQRDIVSQQSKKCSICAENTFPIGDFTHFPIKGVPGDKEPAGGRKLISYNGDNNPFESYEMTGNENCMICTNCAKTYVEGLNWLLNNGVSFKNKNNKDDILYSNRWPRKRSANYGLDTAMVFWTRNNLVLDEIDQLEAPTADDVARMIESPASGKEKDARYLEPERFYSCTLSGAAARIALRDWIEISLGDFRTYIALWFKDIAIEKYDFDQEKVVTHYAPLYDLARSCQRKNSDGSYDKDDTATARVASSLWKAALQNISIPLWILTKVLQRARLDKYGVTAERAALIKLILNRNNKGGGFMITEKMAKGDRPVAYVCGQIFAKLESIQYWASRSIGERNAGIRERYFTYAMTLPAAALGRLFDLSSKHFRKLKNENPGLAINLDKELQNLVKEIDIKELPVTFSLEEKGQFAIGYYHQRQAQFDNAKLKETKKEV